MDCSSVINEYISWLQGNFYSQSFGNECIITTPFLDPSGDSIEIKAIMDEDKIILTDDGETFDYLFLNGIDLFGKSNTRKNIFETSLNKNGAFLYKNSEIAVYVNNSDGFGNAINRLVRTITSMQHMVYTIKEIPFRTFKDEVANLFIKNKIECRSDYNIQGKSLEHKIDFYVVRNDKQMIFKTLSTESGTYAKRLAKETAFTFTDIKNKNPIYYSVSLIDDTQNVWMPEVSHILAEYSDRLLRWTNQDEIIELIA